MQELLVPGSVALVSAKSKSAKRNHSGFTVRNWREADDLLRAGIDAVLVGLCGRAAVDVVFGISDTGADDDIKRAFQTLSSLLGKSCADGFWLHSPTCGFFDEEDGYEDAEGIKQRRQMVASHMLEHYYGKAKRTLLRNRALLERLAAALAEKSYLTSKDIAQLKQGVPLEAPDYL